MSLRARLNRLERDAPRPREPLEVVVTHVVVEPGPDGPVQVGEPMRRRYLEGRLVEVDE